ncbi:MAG: cellulase family glycosylhydrolase [Eubacteriales bacterium]
MKDILKCDGNRLTLGGETVILRGVNCAGLEWDSACADILARVRAAFDDWGANLIRLPVSQDRWFGFAPEQNVAGEPSSPTSQSYRALCDAAIAEAERRDKFVLFELHWSNLGEWGRNIGQHNMPDGNSVVFWHDAAARYKNHPSVIFGLYNEPHDVTNAVWRDGGDAVEGGKRVRCVGMQKLLDTVREVGAENVAVAGGLDWGFDLRLCAEGYALCGENIMYDAHVYPWKPLDWDRYVTLIADRYPILIGEYGHYGDDAAPREGAQALPSGEWVPRILAWIDKNRYNSAAWDFHPGAGPSLIHRDLTPTPFFGEYVKRWLEKSH